MRMWLVKPELMCRKHLMGEHVEMHMFVGTIKAGKSLEGYYRDGLLNSGEIASRHYLLAQEMEKRGMNHSSPLTFDMVPTTPHRITVDHESAMQELARRCTDCRAMLERYHGEARFAHIPRGGDQIIRTGAQFQIVFNGIMQPDFYTTRNKADSAIERIRREYRNAQINSETR